MTAGAGTAVILAAGASRRLGQPKQVLPYRYSTVLGVTLDAVRRCGFDQVIVTLGGAADVVRDRVDLTGIDVVVAGDSSSGCSASLRTALAVVDSPAAGITLLLGDQPDASPATVEGLLRERGGAPIAVCNYTDGIGHPFWLSRSMFGELAALHGDKGVWKLVESGRFEVDLVDIDGPVPLDVDTWDDYQRLLAAHS